MELIYGTYNPAKFESMKNIVKKLDIQLIPLSSLGQPLIASDETGHDPLSNAEEKAINYYKQLKRPIFSCDSGLYFRGVNQSEQPGVKIRRVNGKRLTDDEMIMHYSKLASSYGGDLFAYYKNAICLVIDNKTIVSYDGEDLCSEEFYIIDTPHKIMREGFPLDSLSVHIKSSQYYYDLKKPIENYMCVQEGFFNFFHRVLNNKLTNK